MNFESELQEGLAPSEFLRPCDIAILDRPPHAAPLMAGVERLWYEVYVAEMGRFRDSANHERQQLADEHAQAEGVGVRPGGRTVLRLTCNPATERLFTRIEQTLPCAA